MEGQLRLESLNLFQFKNHPERDCHFKERVIGICGPNGAGKTNLLDAIYMLGLTKSYFSRSDSANASFGRSGFRIHGQFSRKNQLHQFSLVLRENGKKELKRDEIPIPRFSEHIGFLPMVVIAPDDVLILSGHSEERRKWMDTVLCQLNPAYLQSLISYNRILSQRNSLLKQMGEGARSDFSLIDVLDHQLEIPAQEIFVARKSFLADFLPDVSRLYARIAEDSEILGLSYRSQLHELDMGSLLRRNRDADLRSWRTTAGIHRDDIDISLNELPLKGLASQGQRKSVLFALKLGELTMLRMHNQFSPILMLDDVFEKLDERRMDNLLQWACLDHEGQVFLTDTHPERLNKALKKLNIPFQMFNLE